MPFDSHTLELLEFGKIRDLVAGYTVTSLGKELAHKIEPLSQVELIEKQIALVTEMTEIKHPFRAGVKAQPGIEF